MSDLESSLSSDDQDGRKHKLSQSCSRGHRLTNEFEKGDEGEEENEPAVSRNHVSGGQTETFYFFQS